MEDTLLTYDVFWMALIKAFCNREPDQYSVIKVREFKEKVQAVYLDRDGLPFLSQARIMFGDREISMNDFRFAYFDMKDKIHLVLKKKSEGKADDSQDITDN